MSFITEYIPSSSSFSKESIKSRGHVLTKEQIKEREDEMDLYDLEQQFNYNELKIKTMGDLRNLVKTFKSTKEIEKIEDLICDEDYYYIFNWYLKNFVFKKNTDINI
jgi:hypothetical protein